jgi:predicted nucleic acid-binding protein
MSCGIDVNVLVYASNRADPQHDSSRNGNGFFETYREVTASMSVRGNLVPDAHIAAILKQHNISVFYTSDRDFRRFAFLDVRDPFTRAADR